MASGPMQLHSFASFTSFASFVGATSAEQLAKTAGLRHVFCPCQTLQCWLGQLAKYGTGNFCESFRVRAHIRGIAEIVSIRWL